MKYSAPILLSLFILIVSSDVSALPYSNSGKYSNIGRGFGIIKSGYETASLPGMSRLVCVNVEGKFQLAQRAGELLRRKSLQAKLKDYRTRIRELKLQRKLIHRFASGRKHLTKLNKQLRRLEDLRQALKDCRSGALFEAPIDSAENAPACLAAGGIETVRAARVINGDSCETASSPVVHLKVFTSGRFPIVNCSGVAVAPRLVLTAGHCLPDHAGIIEVHTGAGIYFAASFKRHPDFHIQNPIFEENDLGVVIVSEPLPVNVIKVTEKGNFVAGERVIIAGYGEDGNGDRGTLRAGEMKLSSSSKVSLTARFDGSGSNSCVGDSGGPMLVYRGAAWVVGGIISNGELASCGPGDTTRFTNISDPTNLSFLAAFFE